MSQESIIKVLETLSVDNDEHWTSDGQPRVDVVSEKLGSEVTRVAIKAAAPDFTRQSWAETLEKLEAESQEGDGQEGDGGDNPDLDSGGQGSQDEDEDEDEEFESLNKALAAAEKELADADEAFKKVQKQRDEIRIKRDRIIEARERRRPKNSSQNEIRRYLKQQQKIRETASKARKGLSPLDQSFARPTSRPAPKFNQPS